MPNFDLSKNKKSNFRLFWWEIVALAVVLLFTGFLAYGYFFLAQAKNNIFQPKVSSIASYETEEDKSQSAYIPSSVDFSGYTSFLLLGSGGAGHPGGALVDSIQVLILKDSGEAYLISLPRDLYLKVGKCGFHKINTMFWCGDRYYGGGGDYAKELVSSVLGIPINYYVKMDFYGFRELIDALGGLDIEVEKNFNDSVVDLYLTAGWHHLDGETVLRYVRSRYTDSDFDRSRRQQQVILALKDKFLKDKVYLNPFRLYHIIKILSSHLRTDISYNQTISFLKEIPNFSLKNNYVIDNRKDGLLYSSYRNGAYVLLPYGGNFAKIQAKVKEVLGL
ncbi:LCP family protein [bacterium]|nr:LCP family protein [bacterium]